MILEDPKDIFELAPIIIKDITEKEAILRIKNLPKSCRRPIRKIRSQDLGKFLIVEGTIAVATEVKPIISKIKFECPSCGNILNVKQESIMITEPTKCSCGRKGKFRELDQEYIDTQILVLEENIADIDTTDQPRRIRIVLTKGLTNFMLTKHHSPGNRMLINGILMQKAKKEIKGKTTEREYYIQANHIQPIEIGYEEIKISKEDEKIIKKLALREDILTYLADQLAPEIYGHDTIKKALILQQFGGNNIRTEKGALFRRGQIHILLVGDPGSGKTSLMKRVGEISPKSRYSTGAGSSGVGLTASVMYDEMIGGYALHAGTLVLANKGLAMIDEFDKGNKEDLGSLHEALSDGTISINKATIHTTLPAETSLLAGANPIHGRFDPYQPLAKQLNLDLALISRFDLIYPFTDKAELILDEKIIDKMFITQEGNKAHKRDISPEIIKKYIAYGKKLTPTFTKGAQSFLKQSYVRIRQAGSNQEHRTIAITPRYAEALMRLSQAVAKCRLNNKVSIGDAEVAVGILYDNLKQIAFDPETGTLDIDRLLLGETAHNRNIKQVMIRTLREMLAETDRTAVEIDPLIQRIQQNSQGHTQERIEAMLETMQTHGEIFEPRPGRVRFVNE